MKDILDKIDELIRTGNRKSAQEILNNFRAAKTVPLEFRCDFARMARRLAMPEVAVRLLNPIVRPTGRKVSVATDKEKAEYAIGLVRIGSVNEAHTILASLSEVTNPEVLLYKCFAYFKQWDYGTTIPLFEKYITSKITDYERLIGEVNFVQALVHENDPKAVTYLKEVLELTKSEQLKTLRGNTLIYGAEYYIHQKEWKEAKSMLAQAEKCYNDTTGLESLFIEKWKVVLDLAEKGKSALPKLNNFRKTAMERGHWETLRDCDYHQAVYTKDEVLFNKLYFGTPYQSYRAFLEKNFGGTPCVLPKYQWQIGEDATPPDTSYNLVENKGLKVGSARFRLLSFLASDFYRPFRIPEIHDSVFEGEYFNPNSSPKRVHQGISRLRLLLAKKFPNLSLTESKGSFSLRAKKRSLCLVISKEKITKESHFLKQLDSIFGADLFSAQTVSKKLGINVWAVIRLLKESVKEGSVIKIGGGRSTSYQVAKYATNSRNPSAA